MGGIETAESRDSTDQVHGDKRGWREDHAHVPWKYARDCERDTKRKAGNRENDALHMELQVCRHASISAKHSELMGRRSIPH